MPIMFARSFTSSFYFALVLLCLPIFAFGQPDNSLASPYNSIYLHLHYLQADTYQPALAARPFPVADSLEAEQLAIKLKQVFDGRGLYVYLNRLPQDNNYIDSLSKKNYYTLFPNRLPEVYLERINNQWYYSKETIDLIPTLHKRVYPFGMDNLLNWLPRIGQQRFLGLATWQYVGILLLIVVTWLIHRLLRVLLLPVIQRLARRRITLENGRQMVGKITNVLSVILVLALFKVLMPILQLPIRLFEWVVIGIEIAMTIFVVLLALRVLNLVMAYASEYAKSTESRMDEQLLPIIRRSISILVVLGGLIQVLRLLDVNVTALIAGVSIGGLALALAAQDTVKNLLGSFMIFTDRPFQIGDYILAGDIEGSVKEVGFRSTRITTLDSSIIAVPNGTIANMSIKNLGVRVFRVLNIKLGVVYQTPPERIEAFIEQLQQLILNHPLTKKDTYFVRLAGFSDSSIDIMFRAFLEVGTYDLELKVKEELMLAILKLARVMKIEFAFPSTSLYVETMPKEVEEETGKEEDLGAFFEELKRSFSGEELKG